MVYFIGTVGTIAAAALLASILMQIDIPAAPETLEALLWFIVVAETVAVAYLYRQREKDQREFRDKRDKDRDEFVKVLYEMLSPLVDTIETVDERLKELARREAVDRAVDAHLRKRRDGGERDG